MKQIISNLNDDHSLIENFMRRMDIAIAETNFVENLLSMEDEIVIFLKNALIEHHHKEEKFLYHWMVEQNKNSDKDLINRMIDDHKMFEEKAEWIISELALAKDKAYKNHVNFCYEISVFLRRYKEHLTRENNFIFLIAEGLEKKEAIHN